jgi:hypothetical protein
MSELNLHILKASSSRSQNNPSSTVSGFAQLVRLARLLQWEHLSDFWHKLLGLQQLGNLM